MTGAPHACPTGRPVWRHRWLALAPGAGRSTPLDPSGPAWPAPDRLLLVRPDHLGDVLLCGPAVSALRQAWSAARIDMVVGPWSAEIARRLPGLDQVLTVDFPWFDRRPRGAPWRPYARLAGARARLRRAGPYDLAIVLREDDYWGAWLAALADVPLRVAHERPGVRRFATHVLAATHCPRHTAAAALALAGALLGRPFEPSPPAHPLAFAPTPADRAAAAHLLDEARSARRQDGSTDHRPIAVHPGSGAAVKRWRASAWAEVLAAIAPADTPVVLTGSAAESGLTAELAAALGRPALDLAGRSDIGAMAALFERCRLVLGPDSGPLHLAVAVGTPTVHLFGPADASRFGPWGSPERHAVVASRLPCAPCGRLDWPDARDHPCVRSLPVPRVVAAARAVLDRATPEAR